jgi:hypothetical protein
MPKMLTTLLFVMLTLAACSSSATLVRKDPTGGRVDLRGPYMPAMADARLLMVDHCHGRYDAVELGDSVDFRCRKSPAAATQGAVAAAEAAPAPNARGL